MVSHASERFQAPNTILHGVPLKAILGKDLIRLIGASFAHVHPRFDRHAFERSALDGLETLELTPRARQIGRAIAEQLPRPFADACPILLASFGSELVQTEGNGLATFFYLPHGHAIVECGLDDFEHGMRANYELTKRATAEFSIRPFLARYRDQSLALLHNWCSDGNPHVRRLVSEGTRPRLPWASRLKDFQQDPGLTLPLLERLKDDPELYVRRSVANHLGDIIKDHPDQGFSVCERWLKEVQRRSVAPGVVANRKWVIRHAVRLPAKRGEPRAAALRTNAR